MLHQLAFSCSLRSLLLVLIGHNSSCVSFPRQNQLPFSCTLSILWLVVLMGCSYTTLVLNILYHHYITSNPTVNGHFKHTTYFLYFTVITTMAGAGLTHVLSDQSSGFPLPGCISTLKECFLMYLKNVS